MAEQVMKDLEHASQLVLAPPNVVTSEQRHTAENVILDFRKTKMPYSICRYLLENSSVDYVLFQAATTIKEAVAREWPLLSPDDVESLRSFLLRFITKHISLQSYVREQILQTVAVILKRGTLENNSNCDCLFQDVTQLISSGNVTMQLVACSMLSALLNEYSSSSRMSSVGFTWEFHMKCKQVFERSNLKRVFMFSLQVLHEIENSGDQLTREVTAVLNRVLSIAEQILSWEFSPRHSFKRVASVGSCPGSHNVPLRPNEAWRDVLLGDTTVPLFFRIHKKVRHNSEMAHHSLMCISQLASLNGHIFGDEDQKMPYLIMFLEGFLQLLNNVELHHYEHLGVAMTFKNMVMMFPVWTIASLPSNMLESFLTCLSDLTCSMGCAAAKEEVDSDETLQNDAYERLLETWLSLANDTNYISTTIVQPHAAKVFNTFMMCHLSPPRGSRLQNKKAEDEEVEEIEEDDRDKYADQLCSIGALARVVLDQSLPLMATMLEDLVVQYSSHLQHIKDEQAAGKLDMARDLAPLNTLHEDLHWALLVTTHILTEGIVGERPLIPSNIMDCSVAQHESGLTDVPKTLRLLASITQPITSALTADVYCNTDRVIRLISGIIRLCDIEMQAVAASMSFCLSPQVASTAMWCLQRWAVAYLLPNENYYAEISPALNSAFGQDSEGAKWMVDFLLRKISSNVAVWCSEKFLMEDTLMLFVTMVNNPDRAKYVAESQFIWQLAHIEVDKVGVSRVLASVPRRLFMKGLVLSGSGFKDPQRQQEFWKLVLETTRDTFYGIVHQPDFATSGYSGSSKVDLAFVLDSLIGIAQGTRPDISDHIFNFLHLMLLDCVKLLDVYNAFEDIVNLILEVYSEVAQCILCFLGQASTRKLYEVCLSAIQTYSKHHIGRTRSTSSSSPNSDEDDKFGDISIIMELLMHLLAKDFLDLAARELHLTNESIAEQNGVPLDASSVVLYGLEIVVPLMTAELLKFPSLCLQYYKIIMFLADIHADKFNGLPPAMFQNIVASLELGLVSFGTDIAKMCLEVLNCLANQVSKNEQDCTQLSHLTEHFLGVVFRMLLLETFDMTLMDTASSAFFVLICCHPAQYQGLVNQLLEQHSEHKDRLLASFTLLTPPDQPFVNTRKAKLDFHERFQKFMVDVWGFLCVR